MRRRSVLVLVVAAMVISSLTTWVASTQIRSPAELAARTAPPEPSPILVPVEERVLVSKVVTRGTGHYRSPRQLSVTSSTLKSGPQIVTSVPNVGADLREADVLMTISGRPIFVLNGAQPSYRDLGPGVSGVDVAQLERALRRSGFNPGKVDDLYDSGTGRAVASMYAASGFEPMIADEAQLAAARPAEAELVSGARAGPGVQLPSDEVVFVRAAPLRVTDVVAGPGSTPQGPLVTVTDAEVVVDGLLPIEQAELVERGSKVLLDESALGINTTGTISRVAARPGSAGADAFHVSFRVVVDDPPAALVGASVRITVPIESTKQARLTVPVSALSLSADGGSRVRRSVDGTMTYVAVDPGLSADGYVVVQPRQGTLEAGDLVVIGFDASEQSRG